MQIEASSVQQDKMLAYLGLLMKWNRAYNLTSIKNPEEMVSRQLLDSLSILGLVEGPRVLDVGTGAGLPGIPLAIMRPQWEFVLLDSNSKKTRFVNQVRLELGLGNVEVVHSRDASFHPQQRFNTITSRAFAALDDMLQGSGHLLAEDGHWLAMKGKMPSEEIEAITGYRFEVKSLNVQGEPEQRHAVVIRKTD